MAEGFEAYHVPQQSRRDKLRVVASQNQQQGLVESSSTLHPSLLPLYDPSLIPSDLITCATQQQAHCFHNNNNQASKHNLGCTMKQEGSNLMMGFAALGGGGRGFMMNGSSASSNSSSNSSSVSHHAYLDPESSLPLNPGSSSTIQVLSNNNPFLYQPQNLREFDHSYSGSEIMVFKPEPLSLSLSSHNNSTHQSNLPLELNLQRYGSVIYGDMVGGGSASASNEVSRSSVPLGPFTGYASVLKGSRFLKPAQQLLEEICDVGVGVGGVCAEKMVADASLMEPPPECLSAEDPLGDGGEGRKKSRLLTMLDEVFVFLFFSFFKLNPFFS